MHGQGKAGQGRTGQERAGQCRKEQGREGQGSKKQGRAGMGKAGTSRAGLYMAGLERPGQGSGEQGRVVKGRAGLKRTGQDCKGQGRMHGWPASYLQRQPRTWLGGTGKEGHMRRSSGAVRPPLSHLKCPPPTRNASSPSLLSLSFSLSLSPSLPPSFSLLKIFIYFQSTSNCACNSTDA